MFMLPITLIISIHAAREGGDLAGKRFVTMAESFQSTPPVKAATESKVYPLEPFQFQSTPPVKAATAVFAAVVHGNHISIHAAREGGDVPLYPPPSVDYHFNPRRP